MLQHSFVEPILKEKLNNWHKLKHLKSWKIKQLKFLSSLLFWDLKRHGSSLMLRNTNTKNPQRSLTSPYKRSDLLGTFPCHIFSSIFLIIILDTAKIFCRIENWCLLCILTNEQVHYTPFAVGNHFFVLKQVFDLF